MTNTSTQVQFATWITRELRDEAQAAARAADLSLSQWHRRAIREKLDRDRARDNAE